MQVCDHRVEDILKDLISLFVSCVDAHRVLLVVNSALDAELNFAAKVGCSLFHLGPYFLGEVFLEKRSAFFIKDRVVHQRHFLRIRPVY